MFAQIITDVMKLLISDGDMSAAFIEMCANMRSFALFVGIAPRATSSNLGLVRIFPTLYFLL